MRYAGIYDCDISNGKSVGQSLFVQGCHFHCQNCFNSETWDFDGGEEWDKETENKFIELAGRDYIKRITILGGEPLADENAEDVILLVKKLKSKYPDKKIWVYTGYTYEELLRDPTKSEIFNNIDVLVDGRFEFDKRDLTLAFRGSSNQRVIDVEETNKHVTGVWLVEEK